MVGRKLPAMIEGQYPPRHNSADLYSGYPLEPNTPLY